MTAGIAQRMLFSVLIVLRQRKARSSMKSANRVRIAGIIGILSGLLWTISTIMEHTLNLLKPGPPLYVPNQLMFMAAQIGWIVCILGFIWAKAAGTGLFGRIALGLFTLSYVLLCIAEVVKLQTGDGNFFLFPVGGLLSFLAALLSGIAVAVAARLSGWRRYALLAYAIYVILALFIPLVIANQEPTMLTEGIWGAMWMLLGWALVSSEQARA
jgi:hypothetical protein